MNTNKEVWVLYTTPDIF